MTRRVAIVLFGLALLTTVVHSVSTSARQFEYPHAFVSADVATTARTFAEVGIFHLRGVPVNNNPPLTQSDSYTHWPPLLPIMLSICYRIFGVSERVAHLLMLFILVITSLCVFRIGQLWLGAIGGIAGFFWLTLPVTLQFGHLVSQQALMTMFMVAAVLALMEERNQLATVLFFLGALSSWEIVLVVPGLFLASHWNPGLRAKARAALVGTGSGVALVALLYLVESPSLAVDALQAAKFYMGLSPAYSQFLLPQVQLTAYEQTTRMLLNNIWMLGPLSLGAILMLFMGRVRLGVIASLSAPWIVWCLLMRNHMARHHFEFVIASPLAALALAWMATTETKRPALKTSIFAGLALLQILALPKPRISDGYDPDSLIRYAVGIRNATEPNAIVMAPLVSPVPLYYSDRHIIRGVGDSKSASLQLEQLHTEFPASPIYLAIPPLAASNFSGESAAASTPDVIIFKLQNAASTSLSSR
jgi:hypothetical protein